jgi:hypothetical protein
LSLVGKAGSSKKVQRAARAAASSRGTGERRERGFPLLVLLIVVLGIGLVIAARASRDELVAPFLEDHWHLGYEIYDCGELRPALLNEAGGDGIHTHGDSLIHVHPFNSSATGTDADLGVFMEAAGLTLNNDRIEAIEAGFASIDNSTGCGDEDSVIQAARYAPGNNTDPSTIYPDDFSQIRLLANLEVLVIAKIPVGGDMPTPSQTVQAALVTHGAGLNLSSDAPLEFDPTTGAPITGEIIDPDGDTTDDTGTDDTSTDDTETESGEGSGE